MKLGYIMNIFCTDKAFVAEACIETVERQSPRILK